LKPEHSRLRWCVVAVLFSLSFLTIVDRVCISAAKNDMSRELGLSDRTFGFVFGAFALGYAILQIPAGWLVDRYGPRVFLTGVVLLWSLLTGATGLVYASASLIGVRFIFGLAEAGAYPAAGRAIYNWLPPKERGRAQGILFAGSRLGAAFGLAAMSLSILRLGWRTSFLLLGAVGIVWALLWLAWFRDRPAGGPPDQQTAQVREPVPWGTLLLARGVPELMLQYFASNFTFFLCFSWLLPYLKSQYHLTNTEAGVYASMPLYFGALANWTSGAVVDALYRRGWLRQSRLIPAISGFVLAAAALIAATAMPTVLGAVVCFALATFGVDLTLCPSWTACMDIARERTGTLTGVMNMVGNIGSFVSSVTFPYLLDLTHSAKSYFFLAAFLNLAAAACWLRVRPGDARERS
jgi:ACS family glucarate transporter-like MFS transporter